MNLRPDKASLDARPVPQWYQNAKLGIFVHWGLYSIPAYAERTGDDYTAFMRDLTAMKDVGSNIPYAEWYLNSLRVPGSPTARYHEATYGRDFSYADFREQFDASAAKVDFDDWAGLFAEAGAGYAVMVTRHLDGYPLWPTRVAHPHMPADYHASRDLVGDLSDAVRARGLRMGLYYAGGVDWTFVDTPIRTMTDLMVHQSLGRDYSDYAAAHWRELIERYEPSILWNDMGWPPGNDPHEIFAHYYDTVHDGVVNDRWFQQKLPRNRLARAVYLRFIATMLKAMTRGGKALPARPPTFHFDVETHEYATPESAIASAWELTRGLGNSFGYNAQETAADMLSGTGLIHLLADVTSKGGNLLVNVGPDGNGQIPQMQRQPLQELGAWLKVNGEAIYGTRSWTRTATTTADGHPVRFSHKDDTVYAIVLSDRLGDRVVIRNLTPPAGSTIRHLGSGVDLGWTQDGPDLDVKLPGPPTAQSAHVLAMTS